MGQANIKTKPNHELNAELKQKKNCFHHLTKDELIEKLLANYTLQNKIYQSKTS
jgi:ATP-dependent RNA helicase DeaD